MATARKQQTPRPEKVYILSAIMPSGTEKIQRVFGNDEAQVIELSKFLSAKWGAISASLWQGNRYVGEMTDCIVMSAVATVDGATVFAR